jgi:hypothetical protein
MRKPAMIIGTGLILAAASTAANAARPNQASAVKYCFDYFLETGTRISRSDCKTKAEWANVGVDVDEVLKQSRKK